MAEYVPSTKNIWPNYAAGNTAGLKSGDNTLGKDEFLKILIAQISNQDPTNPLQDKEFIAQMAQFTSVEQLMNMAKSLDRLTNSLGMSSSLIGKTITWHDTGSTAQTEPRTGLVEAITIKDGETYAIVNGQEVPFGAIVKVAQSGNAGGETGE